MKILKPYENDSIKFLSLNEPYMKNSIFLAGPCPRDNYEDDWRDEACEILDELGFDGTVLNPTNDHYTEMRGQYDDMLMKQTTWEFEAMTKANAIVLSRSVIDVLFTNNIRIPYFISYIHFR